MKLKTWKKPFIFLAIILIAGFVWAVYTLTNADAYFRGGSIYEHCTSNVVNNPNVSVDAYKMYEPYSSSESEYVLSNHDNKLYLHPKNSSNYDPSWPHAIITCNDKNYSLSHFTASLCKSDKFYMYESDIVADKPINLTKNDWNDPYMINYCNYYACFSNRISTKVSGTGNVMGSVAPEYDYFYMYSPSYDSDGEPCPGDYGDFVAGPDKLFVNYTIRSGEIQPDGSCTLTLVNNSDYKTTLPQGRAEFTAVPSGKAKFDHWEYAPTGNGTSVAAGLSGDILPGASKTFDQEQLMTITAVFIGEELPTPTVTPPTAIEGLYYNGTTQTLVNPGTTTGGTMMYAIGVDDKTEPTGEWTDTLPQGCNIGDYYIWYKVEGNEQWASVPPAYASMVHISQTKPDPVPDPDPPAPDPGPSPDNPEVNEDSISSLFANSSMASIFGNDAYRAPKTSDCLMFGFCLLGLIFAVSVITAGIIRLRKKRK